MAWTRQVFIVPDGKSPTIRCWCQRGNGVEDGASRVVLRRRRVEENDVSFGSALWSQRRRCSKAQAALTERNTAVAHPDGDADLVVGGEASNLVAREQVPDDGRVADIVAHDEAAGATLADRVGRDPRDVLAMAVEAALDGQRAVVDAEDGAGVGEEQEGGRGGAGLEGEVMGAGGDAGRGRLDMGVGADGGAPGRGAPAGQVSGRHVAPSLERAMQGAA